jgi:hypothetical protein
MSHATLIIDGKTEIDGEITPGQKVPPPILADMVKAAPDGKRQPHLMAAAAALASAVMEGKPVQIIVATRPNGWTLTVNHVHAYAMGEAP